MSRRDAERFADILDAIEAIRSHLGRGDLSDGLVYDAVRARLIEIGQAAKNIPAEVVAAEPGTPWRDIASMRDRLAHRYSTLSTPSCRARSRTTSPTGAGRAPPPGRGGLRSAVMSSMIGRRPGQSLPPG